METFDKNREGTGTKEWSEHSYNIQTGCKHNCLYCYARANALRFKQIASREEWTNEVIRKKAVNKKWGKKNGIIMFPTTHDITPDNIEYVVTTLQNMLSAGNEVLIVSKPHASCIERLCAEFHEYKEQIINVGSCIAFSYLLIWLLEMPISWASIRTDRFFPSRNLLSLLPNTFISTPPLHISSIHYFFRKRNKKGLTRFNKGCNIYLKFRKRNSNIVERGRNYAISRTAKINGI